VNLRRFTAVFHERGVPGLTVLVATTDGRERQVVTDVNGEFTLPDDVHGPTLLSATILRPPITAQSRFTSDFTTLTFVAP
jgi:hypothetical protein